jgi:hypothetical protein
MYFFEDSFEDKFEPTPVSDKFDHELEIEWQLAVSFTNIL